MTVKSCLIMLVTLNQTKEMYGIALQVLSGMTGISFGNTTKHTHIHNQMCPKKDKVIVANFQTHTTHTYIISPDNLSRVTYINLVACLAFIKTPLAQT